jgi:hypothetical protein
MPNWSEGCVIGIFSIILSLRNNDSGIFYEICKTKINFITHKGLIMNLKDFLVICGPIIGIILGSFLTFLFTTKSKRQESIIKFKEEKYANLLILLKGFVGNTTSKELKIKFFDEQYKSWLYSSDEVVKALNTMVSLIINSKGDSPDYSEGIKAVGDIVHAMRKDLLGKTKLNFCDFKYTNVN